MMTLPANNRRIRLALWAQKCRRNRLHRLLPAPVLRAQYPDKLAWDWDRPNPYKWNVWMSLNGGASWLLIEDYWMYGDARQFAPDGGSELYFIVGIDESGNEITAHSNIIRPDDAVVPTFVGFPDNGVSTAEYNMTGNELLLHFNGDLSDSSGNGRDVAPYEGGTWFGTHYGAIEDIAYAPFFRTAQGVNFNWAGGRSETNPDWAGAAGSTVMFWAKLSYSAVEADDGFNQPLICFCSSEYNAGLLIVGGIPFDESATPARQDPMVQLNLTHGTYYGICVFFLHKYVWQHVAVVSDADHHQVYVNGWLADENFTETFQSDMGLRFGGWYDDNQMSLSPAVELAEFAVFTRAMSAGEVGNIYQLQYQQS